MSGRAVALPALAVALVAAVLGVQLAAGGAGVGPARAADPCRPRPVVSVSTGLDGLSEELALLGLDGAACRLHETREALVLRLAAGGRRSDAEVAAVRAGLTDAVARLDREHRLPRTSALADEAVDQTDLPGLVKRALHALPDGLVDDRLPAGPLLRRAVADLDVRRLLADLADPSRVQALLRTALTRAVREQLVAGLPHPFG